MYFFNIRRSKMQAANASATESGETTWPLEAFEPAPQPWIQLVRAEHEMLDVARLRYELFIEKGGKAYSAADHERRYFLDPVDQVSLNFRAVMKRNTVAAVRLTQASNAIHDQQLKRFVDASRLSSVERALVCSRMAVKPEMGARLLVPDLFRHIYRVVLTCGAASCVLGTRSELTALFERFGFIEAGVCSDPISGEMKVLVLDVENRERLVQVRSPLLSVLDERVRNIRSQALGSPR